MRLSTTHAEGTRRSLGNRLVLGFAGVMMALAMSVGFAGSASALTTSASNMPHNKAECKHGGWKAFQDSHGQQLFKNQGECVSAVMHMPGGGYGGICTNHSCNTNIDINVDINIIVVGNGNTVIIGFPPMG